MQISLLIHEVFCKQQQCRSVCSYAKSGVQQQRSRSASSTANSCANNDGADQPALCAGTNNSVDQPAHLHSLRLAFGMLTNVGQTRINNVGPTLNLRNLYNLSYVGPTLGHHVGPTEAR